MKITVRRSAEERSFIILDVEDENPYDEGYLMTSFEAVRLLEFWENLPGDDDVFRAINTDDDCTFATALFMEAELTISMWTFTFRGPEAGEYGGIADDDVVIIDWEG